MGPGGLVVDGFMILCALNIWHPDSASRGFVALVTRYRLMPEVQQTRADYLEDVEVVSTEEGIR